MAAQSEFSGDLCRVNDVQVNAPARDFALDRGRQMVSHLIRAPAAVEQQRAAGLHFTGNIVLVNIGLVVHRDKVCELDIIGGADGLITEAQMALGDTVGFLGIILKVGLRKHRGMTVDDFHGIFVGTDRTVRSQAPELAAHHTAARCIQTLGIRQGKMRDIIHNTDGKAVDRLCLFQVLKGCRDLLGRRILGGQAVAAADHNDISAVLERGADILVERFAGAAHFLGAVQHADGADRLGKRSDKALDVEGPEEMHLNKAYLLSAGIQGVDGLLNAAAD